MKTEPRVLMAAGCWVDYVASGYVSLEIDDPKGGTQVAVDD